MLLLAFFGCSAPSSDCGPDEIRLASGGTFSTVADALAAATDGDAMCLGAGTFALSDGAGEPVDDWRLSFGGSLSVTGAGSDQTRLQGAYDGDFLRDLRIGTTDAQVAVEGVTFDGAATRFEGDEVALSDVRVTGRTADGSLALWIDSETYTLDGVVFEDNQLDYGSGFQLGGTGTIRDFSVRGNSFEEGYLGSFHGSATWTGGAVSGNTRLVDYGEGYDMLEFDADLDVTDVTFEGNVTNGPLLSGGGGSLTGSGLDVHGNAPSGRALVTLYDAWELSSATLVDSRFVGNDGGDAAIGLYDGSTLHLERVDFGTGADANAPCDVAIAGACVESELGEAASLDCDAAGCE